MTCWKTALFSADGGTKERPDRDGDAQGEPAGWQRCGASCERLCHRGRHLRQLVGVTDGGG